MNIGWLIDPLEQLKPAKDSSLLMMREAQNRGHQNFVFGLNDLFWQAGQVHARGRWLQQHPEPHTQTWYEAGPWQTQALNQLQAVMVRKDPPFDAAYLYATQLLDLAQRLGVPVWNQPRALRDHNEKLAILQYPQWTAPTMVSAQGETLRAFIAEQGTVVLKPLDAMGGARIFKVSPSDANLSVILEVMTEHGQNPIMAQRYLPAISAGDKRVLLVAGQVMPYALARIPQQGETRGNLAAGGQGVAMPLTQAEQAIAADLAPKLWAQGLFLVGLDVIGGHLTEINVTSPTCMVEIGQQTGYNVAAQVIAALEQTCPAH